MSNRRVHSIKIALLNKSREAAMTAVQIFNNPNILFKSESFIVLINIAWTYLMHAYFREKGIDYRYYKQHGQRKKFDKTQNGAYKYWTLETCLNNKKCPLDKYAKNNLRFIIGIRHEIEHQMTNRLDDTLSARFQACCLNYNEYIKQLFGDDLGIDKHLAFSLQFTSINLEQKELLTEMNDLPSNIMSYINTFDADLSDDEFNSPRFAYRMLFIPKLANRKGQADRVIEFVKNDSMIAKEVNKQYVVIKEKENRKYLPSDIVKMMKKEGYSWFTMYTHTCLWKERDGKNPSKGFGILVASKTWYWYENWIQVVREFCKAQEAER